LFLVVLVLRDYWDIMSAWNILLIDSRISDIETILQSLNAETVGLVFQYDSDTYGSITATIKSKLLQLQDAVSTLTTIEPASETTPQTQTQTPQSTVSARVQAVGILQHNYKTPIYQFVASEPESTLEEVVAADPQLETWTPFFDFVAGLVNHYGVTALDLMACALYSDANWKYVIDTLSTGLGITIRASLDNTGAVESGGNWVLETSGVNLTTVYFTEEIYKWKYVLAIFPDYFVLRTGPSGWRALIPYYPYADITSNLQLWNPDEQFNDYLNGINQIAEQFSYFAGYWLNRNRIQDGTTYSVRVYFKTDVAKDQGSFDFYATSNNPVNTYSGRFTGYNNNIYVLTPQQDGITAGLNFKSPATLTASQTIFYQKFVSGGTVSFNVISSNAGSVSRTHESNDAAVVTIPSSASPSASIAGPGKTTIKVTQPATTNYTEVVNNALITIVIVGQGRTYTSETFPASFDLAGTNMAGSVFTSCNLTGADLFNTTVNASTNFTTSTITGVKSGRITGVTSLLPLGFTII
jgi:hypothetical protein